MKTATFLLILILSAHNLSAQEENVLRDVNNVDDLGNVTDEFQVQFFEALKQKGIENYDRAIVALDKCIALRPEEAILYFEKAKNLALLGNTTEAENNYLKALQLKPDQRDIMEGLYEVYHANNDYDKALALLEQLTQFDPKYREDIARVYIGMQEYERALALLDAMDLQLGKDAYRDDLRQQAYTLSGGDLQEKAIQKQIAENPENEQNYLNLIFIYSEKGEVQKANETAQALLKINPEADAAHLALYKFNLDAGNTDAAVSSMRKVMRSDLINAKSKHRVLNDFLHFVEDKPAYEPQLEQAIALFSAQEDVDLSEELAAYYLKNKEKSKAVDYYKAAYAKDPADFNVLKNLMVLELETKNFPEAARLAESGQEIYPTQPLFYLIYGVSKNALGEYPTAIKKMESGLDYILDDPRVASDFYRQLAIAYEKTGNPSKAAEFTKKANALVQ